MIPKKTIRINNLYRNSNSVYDVVFIQDIGCDEYIAWQYGANPECFWPSWLVEDINKVDIWTISYTLSTKKWVKGATSLDTYSNDLLKGFFVEGIGSKPFILVCRGTGGFLIKGFFNACINNNNREYLNILNECASIFFLSTPHCDPSISNLINFEFSFYGGNLKSEFIDYEYFTIKKFSDRFKEFIEKNNCIYIFNFYEDQRIKVSPKFNKIFKGFDCKRPLVGSDHLSSNNNKELFKKVEGTDYFTISQFPSKKDKTYIFIKERIGFQILTHSFEKDFLNSCILKKNAIKIFISYSSGDKIHLVNLRKALSPLEREFGDDLIIWDDRSINPGKSWENEISNFLEQSDIVLCMISNDFVASEFCYINEMGRALAGHKNGSKIIIPVMLRHCYWDNLPISKIQGVPGEWICSSANRDEAWSVVTEKIRVTIYEIKKRKLKSNEIKEKENQISEVLKKIDFIKSNKKSKNETASEWVLGSKNIITESILQNVLSEIRKSRINSGILVKASDISTFKLHISQIIRDIGYCLFEEDLVSLNRKFDEDYFFDKDLYRLALRCFSELVENKIDINEIPTLSGNKIISYISIYSKKI